MHILSCFILLFNCIILMTFGRLIGRKGSIIFSVLIIIYAWILSIFLLYSAIIYNSYVCYINLFNWITIPTFDIDIILIFDITTCIMLFLILTISMIVQIYSINYMKNDPHLNCFLSYLSLFTFFMVVLVTSNNLIQLFFGWEGVGICSYLLINFWSGRIEANQSAVKAVIVNKIGDCALLIGCGLIFCYCKSFNFPIIFSLLSNLYIININVLNVNIIDLISFFLIIASMAKSAQFLLHVWLADAMEGPTPVSALIHAATMVTAGIFLIIRCSFIIKLSNLSSYLILIIGVLTVFFSSTTAITQNDIKKIIAYSTCSQLGYMMISCSFYFYKSALFHLFTHGFFKALLFLTAGIIIHNMRDEQDLRRFGGLHFLFPLAYVFFLIGSFALLGFPFLSGFYSKDSLLEYIFITRKSTYLPFIVYYICCGGVFLTSIYSLRMLYYLFFINPNGFKSYYTNLFYLEADRISLALLIFLSILSVVIGFLFFDLFLGLGSTAFEGSIYINYNYKENFLKYNEFIIKYPFKTTVLIFLIISVYSIIQFLYLNQFITKLFIKFGLFNKLYIFLNQGWLINFFNNILNLGIHIISHFIFYFDKSLLELYGPVQLYNILFYFFNKVTNYQSNDFFNFFWSFLSLSILIFFFIFGLMFKYQIVG